MKLDIFVKELPLKHTFTIAHQSRDFQETVIVQLEDRGYYGLGECTTNPFYGITVENIVSTLEKSRKNIESGQWATPHELWEMNKTVFSYNPFAQCALDEAA